VGLEMNSNTPGATRTMVRPVQPVQVGDPSVIATLIVPRTMIHLLSGITAVRSISEQIQLVSYLRSNAFVGVVGKRLIQW
jgi:hypothetical protein